MKAIITIYLSLRCFTYIALSNTAWNVGRSVSATEIPRIDSATRFNQIVLQIFNNILIYATLHLTLNFEGGRGRGAIKHHIFTSNF